MAADIEEFIACYPELSKYRLNYVKEPLLPFPLTKKTVTTTSSYMTHIHIGLILYTSTHSHFNYYQVTGWIYFPLFGVPDAIVSDNMAINSRKFCSFADRTCFQPLFINHKYSQANGFAEKGEAVAKALLKKNTDLNTALPHYLAAPIPDVNHSFSQLFYGRFICTTLIVPCRSLQPQTPSIEHVMSAKQYAQKINVHNYNRAVHKVPVILEVEEVYIKRNLNIPTWNKEIMHEVLDQPRSFIVRVEQNRFSEETENFCDLSVSRAA